MGGPITIYEGTWEEVRAHDAELAGRYVRLIAREPSSVGGRTQDSLTDRRERWKQFRNRMEQQPTTVLIPDSVDSVRAARAGDMFDSGHASGG